MVSVRSARSRQRQLAQALGDLHTLLAALLVKDAVGVVILLPVRGKEQHEKDQEAAHNRQGIRQVGTGGEMFDKTGHDQEQ